MDAIITTEIDLARGAQEMRQKAEELDQELDELAQELKEEYGSFREVPAEAEQKYERKEEERIETEGQASALERTVEAWGGDGVVEVKELTGGEFAMIRDGEFEEGEGAAMVAVLRRAIIDTPAKASDDPADWPNQAVSYLFERVNAINTVGEVELGNLSLEQRMSS